MTDEAALEALNWLEARRGKPVTAAWYIERDGKLKRAIPPMPAKVEPGREGAWRVVYGNGMMQRILKRREFELFTVTVDKQRLVIDYGSRHGNRQLVLEATER